MPTATASDTAVDMRRFAGNERDQAGELDHPVDALGHVRWNVPLATPSISRSDDDNATIGFKGHAAVFNSQTLIGSKRWGFLEQIAPGAFRKTIAEADVRLLLNHDPSLLLARNQAGNLRLSEDNVGLLTDADMVPTSFARDLAMLMEVPDGGDRATIDQMSFAFEPLAWTRETIKDDDGAERDLITLTEVRLFDVSIVTYPAYADTDAGLRSAAFTDLARELDTDPAELLRRFRDGKPLLATRELSDDASRGSTGDDGDSQPPPEGTGERDSQPADVATGEPTETRRALQQRTLRMRTNQIKEI